ncbi:MAG: fibronectin type III domain-containing protein [Actinobacteria bacterium]|nr:fibronectin type III domain-containing protein [Actinomycetota bacterium]
MTKGETLGYRCSRTVSRSRAAGLCAVLAALGALTVSGRAAASTPAPWCGTDLASVDRRPDGVGGPSFHVVYAVPAGTPDRFAEWAPRIVGDVAEIELWWRLQDPTRAPRFDLHAFACGSSAGRLDLSRVQLQRPAEAYGVQSAAYASIVGELAGPPFAFHDPDKLYLVYYDGPVGGGQVCGTGARSRAAVVFARSCGQEIDHDLRATAAAHELLHVLGAVQADAPHVCPASPGHACDGVADLMYPAAAPGQTLLGSVLDIGRNDYYGQGGGRLDIRDSLFLERLDGSDSTPPSTPAGLTATNDESSAVALAWSPSSDDVGPVTYRLYRDGLLLSSGLSRPFASGGGLEPGRTVEYAVRAADPAGHLSEPVSIRFKLGVGIVDAAGRLVRDTVAPGRIGGVRVRRLRGSLVVRWARVADPGGLRGYEVQVRGGPVRIVGRPEVSVPRGRRASVLTVRAVDRAGNRGPRSSVRAG